MCSSDLFLGALVELGYGFAYRVLDAQHFGVAQRRRRVFVVGHLGDWRPTAKVLFESESLQRNIKQSREKRAKTSFGTDNIVGALCARDYKGISADNAGEGKIIAHAFKIRGGCEGGGKGYLGQDEQAFTISTVQDQQISNGMAVRRLTPVECERLQGFPDNYTNIKENCPDGPRYKALGNSMAVPVMRWIGTRIQMVEDGLI